MLQHVRGHGTEHAATQAGRARSAELFAEEGAGRATDEGSTQAPFTFTGYGVAHGVCHGVRLAGVSSWGASGMPVRVGGAGGMSARVRGRGLVAGVAIVLRTLPISARALIRRILRGRLPRMLHAIRRVLRELVRGLLGVRR